MKACFRSLSSKLTALILVFCLLTSCCLAETESAGSEGWVSFLLICNEGMKNDGSNTGNTEMLVSMNPENGTIRLMMLTWDTFIAYEGYDVPQKLDMPFRNNGPEETLKVINSNFDLDIQYFLSLNYLNLASLIDSYDGVNVDISRAERNALNGMVASKKQQLQLQLDMGLLGGMMAEMLADEYYLNEFGPDTHLNGLQAVGFGWLQYDSVYNCCMRDASVISSLFASVADSISSKVILYTNESGAPEETKGRRAINLDNMTPSDMEFVHGLIEPIFSFAYNNLSQSSIDSITKAFAWSSYLASRQGVNIFSSIEYDVFPLEKFNAYDYVAGTAGHLIDYEANSAAIKEFLYGEN